MWDLCWMKWHWDSFSSKYLFLFLSVSFHQCCILTFNHALFLPEEQTDETWEPYKSNALLKIRKHSIEKYKGKAIPLQPWTGPEGSRSLRLQISRKSSTRRWKVCQLYAPAVFTPQEIFLISVRDWVNPRVTVRTEGLCQWKTPMTSSGIEPATFRFVARCLNRLSHRVPRIEKYLLLVFKGLRNFAFQDKWQF